MSSTRCVTLRFSIHSRRYSEHAVAGCHSNRRSSKPSPASGRLNFVKDFARSVATRSGKGLLRKTTFFSSSVSSTGGSSTLSSAAPAGASASAFSAVSPVAAALAFCLLASRSFFLSSSAFFFLASASALALFSLSSDACTPCLCSSLGSPIEMMAVFLKPGKRAMTALRVSAVRLPFTSATTKLRGRAGAMDVSMRRTLMSSNCAKPKPVSGLSLQPLVPKVLRTQPLFVAHSMTALLLSSTCAGCFMRNWSTASNVPSSGSPTGKTTSYFPSWGTAGAATSQSAAAASCNIRHLKGRSFIGGAAKLTRSDVPL
mmetsp:Transcript_114697/g.370636  ORF Transcript_114697/g.370636 Transcript_114697/m.370636 type:complete len:315 (-) Transcript_114697:501-1445(-)